MKPRNFSKVSGGFMVEVEFENAYTDGTSRFEKVFVSTADMRGTREEKLQALKDAFADPLTDIQGDDLSLPVTQTKAVWERRAVEAHATWLRWKTTREEAVTRTMPAAVITALTNREDTAWADYTVILQAWRTA